MSDLRFDSRHLESPRRDSYRHARGRLLDARGPVTVAAEWADHLLPPAFGRPTVGFALVHEPGGVRFPLRVGLTAIGRYPENDIVLAPDVVSRRHCVVIVHTDGRCEVHDTASRNGTRVNGRRVDRAWLAPGDVLQLCDSRFVLTCEGGDDPPGDRESWGTGRWGTPNPG